MNQRCNFSKINWQHRGECTKGAIQFIDFPTTSKTHKNPMSTPSRFFRGCRALFYASKSSAAAAPNPVVSTSKKNPSTSTKKKPPPSPTAGILKSTPVSPALQSLVGAPEISRAGAVKKIWEYIKLHNLQVFVFLFAFCFYLFIFFGISHVLPSVCHVVYLTVLVRKGGNSNYHFFASL